MLTLGLKLIRSFEGCKLTAYWDPYGKRWTIAWGHTSGVKEGDTCTQDQADAWAEVDLFPLLSRLSQKSLLEGAALLSFGHNCGISALDRVLSGEILVEHEEFMVEENMATHTEVSYGESSGGTVLEGLKTRRQLEAALIEASRTSS